MCRVTNQQTRLPRATSSLALNASRDGASTASLGNLFQWNKLCACVCCSRNHRIPTSENICFCLLVMVTSFVLVFLPEMQSDISIFMDSSSTLNNKKIARSVSMFYGNCFIVGFLLFFFISYLFDWISGSN